MEMIIIILIGIILLLFGRSMRLNTVLYINKREYNRLQESHDIIEDRLLTAIRILDESGPKGQHNDN